MTVSDQSTTTETHGAVLTDAAAAKAKALLNQEGRDDLALRIAVQPGGCAGLRYHLLFDDRSLSGDINAAFVGVTLTSVETLTAYMISATFNCVITMEKKKSTMDNSN